MTRNQQRIMDQARKHGLHVVNDELCLIVQLNEPYEMWVYPFGEVGARVTLYNRESLRVARITQRQAMYVIAQTGQERRNAEGR